MRQITDSRRKIADLIGAIDGMVFQAHVLALGRRTLRGPGRARPAMTSLEARKPAPVAASRATAVRISVPAGIDG